MKVVVADYVDDKNPNNDVTITTSNCSTTGKTTRSIPSKHPSLAATARQIFGVQTNQYLNAITNATTEAIADTGGTSIFIMEGTPVENLRPATALVSINLPDGTKVKSTHMCNINITIPGLPIVLMGHIVPQLLMASLIGIWVLCKAGCKVLFTKAHCDVIHNNKFILCGYKDPSTNLWTLPINTTGDQIKIKGKVDVPHENPPVADDIDYPNVATFIHSIRTRANVVMFAHQSLCNPKISTLLKATQCGFLQGCPNMNKKLMLKYLNPSPAMAKEHMKRPRHGIQSTTPKPTQVLLEPIPNVRPPILPLFQEPPTYPGPTYRVIQGKYPVTAQALHPGPNVTDDDENNSIANIFCFGEFADKRDGVVYNDLTGSFPFVSLDGSVYFLSYTIMNPTRF
jgi:hypothetical protein